MLNRLSNLPHHPVCISIDGEIASRHVPPQAIFPGSFNPLHQGHLGLVATVERTLRVSVAFELSVVNVDKPELSSQEIERRLQQFRGIAAVWLTRAPTFEQKVEIFPECTFVLGYDTAERLIDPRYYGDDRLRRDEALKKIRDRGARFVVGGRKGADGSFRVWNPAVLGVEFEALFLALNESEFRVDCASRDLRQST